MALSLFVLAMCSPCAPDSMFPVTTPPCLTPFILLSVLTCSSWSLLLIYCVLSLIFLPGHFNWVLCCLCYLLPHLLSFPLFQLWISLYVVPVYVSCCVGQVKVKSSWSLCFLAFCWINFPSSLVLPGVCLNKLFKTHSVLESSLTVSWQN